VTRPDCVARHTGPMASTYRCLPPLSRRNRQGIDTGQGPLTPASARKEMTEADIPDTRGYPTEQVSILPVRDSPGRR
jgi:hypothetical protein